MSAFLNPPRASLGEGDRRPQAGGGGAVTTAPYLPLHHPLRGWSPSPSKLGEE